MGRAVFGLWLNCTTYSNEKVNTRSLHENVLSSTFIEISMVAEQRGVNLVFHSRLTNVKKTDV